MGKGAVDAAAGGRSTGAGWPGVGWGIGMAMVGTERGTAGGLDRGAGVAITTDGVDCGIGVSAGRDDTDGREVTGWRGVGWGIGIAMLGTESGATGVVGRVAGVAITTAGVD